MIALITGSVVLSLLHALIPNHWLPVLAISKREQWSLNDTTLVILVSGFAHALSTVLLGLLIGLVGVRLADNLQHFTHFFAPIILIGLGVFFIYQHYRHKHFHLHASPRQLSKGKIVLSLAVAMFFSPCFEIEAYFLMAGAQGWRHVVILSVLYTVITVTGMVLWVRLTYRGLVKLNWHSLEHNAGIITGVTLVATGIASFFIH
jgi:putative Mn2+ efflux pump MntP